MIHSKKMNNNNNSDYESSIIHQIQISQILHSCSISLRNAVLKNCTQFTIEFLSDLAYNFLRGNIECTKQQFSCLKSYRVVLKKLSASTFKNSKTYDISIRRKRQILCRIKDNQFWKNFLLPVVKRNDY